MQKTFACALLAGLTFALLAGLTFALPAAAQVAGTPGAIGSTGAMSGHNTPGGVADMHRHGRSRHPGTHRRHHHM